MDGASYEVKLPAQVCQECGETTIPGPEVRKATESIRAAQGYSGKLIIRMSPTLHKRVADLAREHGKSLNQELVEIIERGTKKAVGE